MLALSLVLGLVRPVRADEAGVKDLTWIFAAPMNGETSEELEAKRAEARRAVLMSDVANVIARSTRPRDLQLETVSAAGNSTAVADEASASSFFSMALNLAGMGMGSGDSDASSASATVNLYTLYAAARGFDPLADDQYCTDVVRPWRRWALTLGYDDEVVGGSSIETDGEPADEAKSRTIDVGAKWTLNPDHCDKRNQLAAKAAMLSDSLEKQVPSAKYSVLSADGWRSFQPGEARLLTEAGDEMLAASREFLEAMDQDRPNLAVSALTRQREGSSDEYSIQAIWTQPLARNVSLSSNGGFEFHGGIGDDPDSVGGRAAAELILQMWSYGDVEALPVVKPMTVKAAASGEWLNHGRPQLKLQLKTALPLGALLKDVPTLSSVELPISVTWANKADLVDEDEVRGQIGFTIDTSQLAGAFGAGAAD